MLPSFLLQDNFKHHQALANDASIAARVPLESFYLPYLMKPIENQKKFENGRVSYGPRPKQTGKVGLVI